ncbi:MAG: phosphoglycerate kinase [Candidatus Puniceispirillaceae bacterium]
MTANFQFADQMDVAGKTVLLRLDVNVPLADGVVSDDTRIRRVMPGVQSLLERGAKVVVLTHFGRPKGTFVPGLTVRPVAHSMAGILGQPVSVESDVIGPGGKKAVAALAAGDILMMENLRFYPEEEANDLAFAKSLAALGDLYVGDAFSCAHRAHASVDALPRLMPSAAGRSFAAELEALNAALSSPVRPLGAVVGGAKVSSKLALLENLVTKVDGLVLGGGMANTFLLAKGKPVGVSLAEPDMVDTARRIMDVAAAYNCQILLPQDVVVAVEFKLGAAHRLASSDDVADGEMILDAGAESVVAAIAFLDRCSAIVWNGPMGAFEIPPFDAATTALARAVATKTQNDGLMSVAGGGDTMAALANAGVNDQFSYVSTAGGAFLEWLEGKRLPGVEALRIN